MTLPTLMSQAYVAFTIEFDNEWERRMRAGGRMPRFLVSYVMWANLMRWVTDTGIQVGELEERAGVWNGPIHLGRMEQWWGYVSVTPGARETRSKPPRTDLIVRPTPQGEVAIAAWDGLDTWVDDAWERRLGRRPFAGLKKGLSKIERELDLDLPDAMPVLSYADGYRTPRPEGGTTSPARSRPETIGALLARVLLAFTLEYEQGSDLPLAIDACLLRVLGEEPVSVKEVPLRAGVRKEATDPALKFLAQDGYLETAGSGAKMTVRLTSKGQAARSAYLRRVRSIERAWDKRFGEDTLSAVREAVGTLYEEGKDGPKMAAGLTPPPGCWRGSKPYLAQTQAFLTSPADSLPHHPLLTHRGGWPDGA